MNTERNKFLTEAMGECWHEVSQRPYGYYLFVCKKCGTQSTRDFSICFSTWEGFGKLWEWAKKQDWWSYFSVCRIGYYGGINQDFIHPDNFADALYSFLKENKP